MFEKHLWKSDIFNGRSVKMQETWCFQGNKLRILARNWLILIYGKYIVSALLVTETKNNYACSVTDCVSENGVAIKVTEFNSLSGILCNFL